MRAGLAVAAPRASVVGALSREEAGHGPRASLAASRRGWLARLGAGVLLAHLQGSRGGVGAASKSLGGQTGEERVPFARDVSAGRLPWCQGLGRCQTVGSGVSPTRREHWLVLREVPVCH